MRAAVPGAGVMIWPSLVSRTHAWHRTPASFASRDARVRADDAFDMPVYRRAPGKPEAIGRMADLCLSGTMAYSPLCSA